MKVVTTGYDEGVIDLTVAIISQYICMSIIAVYTLNI